MSRWFVIGLIALCSLVAGTAQAQSGERAAAIELAKEGLGLFQTEKYRDALDRFSRAHALVGAPTTGLWKARCLEKVGRWVEATELYLDVAERQLDDASNPKWRKAIEEARTERSALLPRVPKLKIVLTGPGAATANVRINGNKVRRALVGVFQPIDPGEHLVEAGSGDALTEKRLVLAAGQSETVELDVKMSTAITSAPETVNTPSPTPQPPVTPPTKTEDASSSDMEASSSNIGAWVAFGIAGAGLVATGVLTGLTVQSEAELNDICSNRVCPPKVTSKVESYETMKAATFGAAAATGAAAITGTILLFTIGSDPAESSATWSPVVAPNYIGIRGSF